MNSSSMLNEKKFWKVMNYLLQLNTPEYLENALKDLSINKKELNIYIHFLKDLDYQFSIVKNNKVEQIIPPPTKPKIKIEFSLYEWMEFQAHFPALSSMNGKPFHDQMSLKIAAIENEYKAHDIFGPLELLERAMNYQSSNFHKMANYSITNFLEESILNEKCVNIQMNKNNFIVYPRKIVFFDGFLTLVAEGVSDKCLLNLNIREIKNIFEDNTIWDPIYSRLEVEDFICGLRLISGNEVRLVLKVHSYERFDPRVRHQFLGSPCMITNPEGEVFWGATIEPSSEIFEWLENLGTDVEILDPTSFKKEYLKYCENKLKKIA